MKGLWAWRWRLLGAWAVLLLASHAVRLWRPYRPEPGPEDRVLELHEVRGEERLEGLVRLVYRDSGPEDPEGSGNLPVLLLHGSPGRRTDLLDVGSALAEERRVLGVDLPGFGRSSADIADYSFRAHADYCLQLLDALEIERAHLVAYSMGGGVALELSARAPERVASIAMISAIGVQELELFGSYHLNHAVHGLQLAGLWLLREGFPHFGYLDDAILSVAYARNFFDSDQRPLRGILEAYREPMLILHGRTDPLVSLAAAEEHARVVPQSELQVLEGGHLLVFTEGRSLGRRVAPFLDAVEAGSAPRRVDAAPDRRAAALEPFDPRRLPPLEGLAKLVLLFLAALATLVSEDLTCIGIGAMVGQGRVDLFSGTLACFLGIYAGDLGLYAAGRTLGAGAASRAPLSWFLTPARVARSSAWFEKRGALLIFLTRFLPGTRLATYFAAGVLKVPFWRFAFYFAVAAGVWTPILVWGASVVGAGLFERIEFFQRHLTLGLGATVVVVLVVVKGLLPLASARGRRRAVGSWRRLTRWEYWPPWVVYPPVVLSTLWRGLRLGNPLAFTASNPAIPHAGFVGESKAPLLEAVRRAGGDVPEFRLLDRRASSEERLESARALAREVGFPLVVKPDVGQRGEGVEVVRSEEELAARLARDGAELIVQAHVEGCEFGLFYVHHPDWERGRLWSVTEKRLPTVEGDGSRSLEALILADERAVCSYESFADALGEELDRVPAAGERVRLTELGTHCKGAVFLDGREHATPALETALDELSQGIEGFSFGRYDVRSPSLEALGRGEFHVLEVNGVTSEAAHVYDPRYSIFAGWRTLIAQWSLAQEIGAAHAKGGARVSRVAELWRAVRSWRSGEPEAFAPAAEGKEGPLCPPTGPVP